MPRPPRWKWQHCTANWAPDGNPCAVRNRNGLCGRHQMRGKGKHPNSHAREVVLQALYQLEVGQHPLEDILRFGWLNADLDPEKRDFCLRHISEIHPATATLEAEIAELSKKHISQISTVSRCILRMAIYELGRADLDARIIIDDALNLTRKYDGEESVGFVNGILDEYETRRVEAPADVS